MTMATATELQSMSDLLPEVRELRDSLVSSLKTRFPRQEAVWMSLLKLEQAHLYPDKVIAHKYTLLIDRLKHATNEDLHSKETVAAFVTEYQKMRAKYEQMIEAGVEAHLLTFDTVAPWDEPSYSWKSTALFLSP